MWDAAFTIQSAHRRMRLRRRRRARALKRAMGASNAATAWNQALEHGHMDTEVAAAAARQQEKELDGENGSDYVEGLATRGEGTRGRNDRGQLGSAVAVSPPAHGGNDNTNASGIANTVHAVGDDRNGAAGQGPASDFSPNASNAAAPTEPKFEDMGDIALAAVRLAQNPAPTPTPTPTPTPPMPAPTMVVLEPTRVMQPRAKPVSAPPSQNETLEYYEAKMRYLAAQEKAHGASATKIQASKEHAWRFVQRVFPGHAPFAEDSAIIVAKLAGASVRDE